jgi:uncharacterized lipoprotein YmbA
MLTRVLVEELNQRLPGSTVYAETGAVSALPDATIELNIVRLDENAAGVLVLQAQAAITRGRATPVTRAFRFEIPPSGSSIADHVAASSVAVGQLADGLAAMFAPAGAPARARR